MQNETLQDEESASKNEPVLQPERRKIPLFWHFVILVLACVGAYLAYQNWQLKKDILAIQFTGGRYTNKEQSFSIKAPDGFIPRLPKKSEQHTLVYFDKRNNIDNQTLSIKISTSDSMPPPPSGGYRPEDREEINNRTFYKTIIEDVQISKYVYGYITGEHEYILFELFPYVKDQADDLMTLRKMLASYTALPKAIDYERLSSLPTYKGEVSPQVPYKGLVFKEIDIHHFANLRASLDQTDYQEKDAVFDGYTFTANQGENFEFLSEEDFASNPGSFIRTELYGYGPTVVKMETRIGWGVPTTGRYFYVIKGENHYGNGTSGLEGHPYSKYGIYTLKITQRN